MAIFGSVSGKGVDAFAKSLARELAERWPPDAGQGGQRILSRKRLVSTLESVFNKAVSFKDQHKLGIYKKARLGNTFRWELVELGYDKAFVNDVTERLVVYLARKDAAGMKREPARS